MAASAAAQAAEAGGSAQAATAGLAVAAAGTQTLNQALEAAWQRSLEASESRGRYARAQADQAVTQSWLAAAPAVSIGQREGRAGAPAANAVGGAVVAIP